MRDERGVFCVFCTTPPDLAVNTELFNASINPTISFVNWGGASEAVLQFWDEHSAP